MKDTPQRAICKALKKETGISNKELAKRIGVSDNTLSVKMNSKVRFAGMLKIIKAYGYDVVLVPAPSYREPEVSIGFPSCEGCKYKGFMEDVVYKAEQYKEVVAEEERGRVIVSEDFDDEEEE